MNKPVSGKPFTGIQNTWPFLVDGDADTCAVSHPAVYGPTFVIDLGGSYYVDRITVDNKQCTSGFPEIKNA